MISKCNSKKSASLLVLSFLMGSPAVGEWDPIDDIKEYAPSNMSVRFTISLAPPRNQLMWESFRNGECTGGAHPWLFTRNIPSFFDAHQIVSCVDPNACFPFALLPMDVKFLVATFLSPYDISKFALTSKANWVATQSLPHRRLIREIIREQNEREEEKRLDSLLRIVPRYDLHPCVNSTDCSLIIEFLFLTEEDHLEKGEKFISFSKMIYDLECEYNKKCVAQNQPIYVEFDTILKCVAILKAKLAIPTEECIRELLDLHLNRGLSARAIVHIFENKASWWKEQRAGDPSRVSFFSILKPFTADFPDYFMREALKRISCVNLDEELTVLSQKLTKGMKVLKVIDSMTHSNRVDSYSYNEYLEEFTAPDYLEAVELLGPDTESLLKIASQMNLLAYFPSPKKFKEVLGRLQKSDEKARDFVVQDIQERLIIQSPGRYNWIWRVLRPEIHKLACQYKLIGEENAEYNLLDTYRLLDDIYQIESVLLIAQKHGLLNEDRAPKNLRPILKAISKNEKVAEATLSIIEQESIFTSSMSSKEKGNFISAIAHYLNSAGKSSEIKEVMRFLRSHFTHHPSCHLFTLFLNLGSDRGRIFNLASSLPQGEMGLVFAAVRNLEEDAEEIIALAQHHDLLNETMTEKEVDKLLMGLRGLLGDREEVCKAIKSLTRASKQKDAFLHFLEAIPQLGGLTTEILSLPQKFELVNEAMTGEEIADLLMGLISLEGNREEICDLSQPFIPYCSNGNKLASLLITVDELGDEAKEIVSLVQGQHLLNKAMSGQDIIDLLVGLKAIEYQNYGLIEAMKPLLRDSLQGDEVADILEAGWNLDEKAEDIVRFALDNNLITEEHFQKVRRHPGHNLMKTFYLSEIIDTLYTLHYLGDDRKELCQAAKGVLGEEISDWPSLLLAVERLVDYKEICQATQCILRKGMGRTDRERILHAVSGLGDLRNTICKQASLFIKDWMNHEDVRHILKGMEELEEKASEVIERVQLNGLIQDHMNGYDCKQILRVVGEIGSKLEPALATTQHLRNPTMSGREVAHILRDFVQY